MSNITRENLLKIYEDIKKDDIGSNKIVVISDESSFSDFYRLISGKDATKSRDVVKVKGYEYVGVDLWEQDEIVAQFCVLTGS